MDLENTKLNEISQRKTNTVRCHYVWNLKNVNDSVSKMKQTHRHRKQIYGYQRGERGEGG